MIFLLMAAHDTTTTTMTSMAYLLAKHPEWQERCRAEAQAMTDPSYDDAQKLTDLDLVMKESLRICAPVPTIPRTATRDVAVNGYRIPKGAVVTANPYVNHYRDEVWPDPERFDPERFSSDRHEDKVHRLAFQAFGAGVHKCIGMHFAGMEVRATFHELLDDLQVVGARGLRDADRPRRPPGRPRRPAGEAGAVVRTPRRSSPPPLRSSAEQRREDPR